MNIYDVEKQHERGKLHVYERIDLLFDKNSFVEFNRSTLGDNYKGYDGVVTGYGFIDNKKIYFYGQDFTYMGGTFGLLHSRQIIECINKAIDEACPIIAVYDGGGARIQEGAAAVAGCAELFNTIVKASGYIPQIAVVAGTCAGGAVYAPGLSDFVYTIEGISNMFVTGSRVINEVEGTDYLPEELGGAAIHSSISGVASFICASESECYKAVKKLINTIPLCYKEKSPITTSSLANKDLSLLQQFLPKDTDELYDIRSIIYALLDIGTFIEIQKEFARNLVVGLGKLGDITVGIVASQPIEDKGVVDCDAADKGTRFVNYCDAFNIPIITLADSTGFRMKADEERKGLIRHGAKLIYAYSEATTIKLTVIVRKAYGGPYILLGSKQLEGDRSYVWPNAQVAVMPAKGAVAVIYHSHRIEENPEAYLAARLEEYNKAYMNSKMVLDMEFVDRELDPSLTRDTLYHDILDILSESKTPRINKKHGNTPV